MNTRMSQVRSMICNVAVETEFDKTLIVTQKTRTEPIDRKWEDDKTLKDQN